MLRTQKLRYIAKLVARHAAPRLYKRLRESRHDRLRSDLSRITATLVSRNLLRVTGGPFKGMQYTREATAAHFPPKMLGAYESELHEVMAQVIRTGYDVIVDVGCSEGYYAVGLALCCPTAHVHAFDTDENSRRWCAGLAKANGVGDRVIVGGECTPGVLEKLNRGRVFLLSDCEGFETELLDPARAPALRSWDVLVELHDCYNPRTTQLVLERFSKTHEITTIEPAGRDAERYGGVEFLSRRDRRLAVSDLRGERTHWAFMRARGNGSQLSPAPHGPSGSVASDVNF